MPQCVYLLIRSSALCQWSLVSAK